MNGLTSRVTIGRVALVQILSPSYSVCPMVAWKFDHLPRVQARLGRYVGNGRRREPEYRRIEGLEVERTRRPDRGGVIANHVCGVRDTEYG